MISLLARAGLAFSSAALGTVGWMGWVTTGERTRTSYETFRSAQRLGLDALTPFRVVWFLLPVVALAAIALLGFDRRRLACALAVALALIVGGVAIVVMASGLRGGAVGPLAALAMAVAALAAAAGVLLTQGRTATRR